MFVVTSGSRRRGGRRAPRRSGREGRAWARRARRWPRSPSPQPRAALGAASSKPPARMRCRVGGRVQRRRAAASATRSRPARAMSSSRSSRRTRRARRRRGGRRSGRPSCRRRAPGRRWRAIRGAHDAQAVQEELGERVGDLVDAHAARRAVPLREPVAGRQDADAAIRTSNGRRLPSAMPVLDRRPPARPRRRRGARRSRLALAATAPGSSIWMQRELVGWSAATARCSRMAPVRRSVGGRIEPRAAAAPGSSSRSSAPSRMAHSSSSLPTDVVVEAAAVHAERLAEVLHRGRVEAALAEEPRRGLVQLGLAGAGGQGRLGAGRMSLERTFD